MKQITHFFFLEGESSTLNKWSREVPWQIKNSRNADGYQTWQGDDMQWEFLSIKSHDPFGPKT